MSTQVVTLNDFAVRIGKSLENLAKSINDAGKILVEAMDTFPDARDQFAARFTHVPPRMWTLLEKVGRGVIDGRIALGCQHSFQLQRLPLSEQRKALDQPLDLALPGGDSCKVKLQNATPEQARQLIGSDSIRSVEQQAAWMHDQNVVHIPRVERAALSFEPNSRKGEVVFYSTGPGQLVLSKGDLLDLLRKLG